MIFRANAIFLTISRARVEEVDMNNTPIYPYPTNTPPPMFVNQQRPSQHSQSYNPRQMLQHAQGVTPQRRGIELIPY